MLFGTDGIRGTVNQYPIEPVTLLKIMQAIGTYFHSPDRKVRCIIGKDTRISGYMIECACVSGLVSKGIDVILLGPLPTPAVSMLTRSLRADFGIMISASHNPYYDNGLKFFDASGNKLSAHIEKEIEQLFEHSATYSLAQNIGKAVRLDDARGRYIEFVKSSVSSHLLLKGWKIVLDCANGACYKTAPKIFEELGADVIVLSNTPDGKNINALCGSTHPYPVANAIVEHKADIGIALDGDGDRVTIVDETGSVITGEHLLGFLALAQNHKRIVTTVIANPGLEQYLIQEGIQTLYSEVGDSKVSETMMQYHCKLGGEPSGHFLINNTPSDGIFTALQIIEALINTSKKPSEIQTLFPLFPQITKNITLPQEIHTKVNIESLRTLLSGSKAKFLIRKSGTEPMLRLYMWDQDKCLLQNEFQKTLTLLDDLIAIGA